MPDQGDFINYPNDDFDVFEEFLGEITCRQLAMQMKLFIILIIESSSELAAKKELVRTMKWLNKFRKENFVVQNQKMVREAELLARKLRLECLAFKVPFFWENTAVYNTSEQNNKPLKGMKTVQLKGLFL